MAYRPRKYRRQEDNNLDDWLMTYADLITLLLCFFAVFLSVSVPKKDVFETARKNVLETFAHTDQQSGTGELDPVGSDTDTPYDSMPSIIDRFQGDSGNMPEEGFDGFETEDLGFDQDGGAQGGKAETITENSTDESSQDLGGDRIQIIEIPSGAFFDSGAATLSNDGKTLLGQILGKLQAEDLQDYQITVEGHTDDVPIQTVQFPSNWELSTARAAAVVRFFIEEGVSPERLRAAGYADVLPKLPNRDTAGKAIPENQALNRRVLIKLEKIEKAGE